MSAQLFLALIASPIATIMVVMLGVFFQNGLVDACISVLNRAMDQRFTDSVGCLETLIHAEVAKLRTDIAQLRSRLERIDGQRRIVG